MTRTPPIEGFVASGFDGARDAFAANWERNGEVGASLCVYHEGDLAVDLRGGWVDRAATAAYPADGLQVVYSATKGIAAMATAVLVDRGQLDLDAPIATYWPEFASGGKTLVTTRDVLSHRAGLPALDTPLTTDEVLAVEPVLRAIETQQPLWPIDSGHGYHAFTLGWIVGEVVRRIAGVTIGEFVRDELCAPLGVEFWIGLPAELFYFGSDTAFGHYGAGGSAAFADPATGVAFAYVMNYMATWLGHDPRVSALVDAVNDCL